MMQETQRKPPLTKPNAERILELGGLRGAAILLVILLDCFYLYADAGR